MWLRDAAAMPFGHGLSPLAQMLRGNVSDLLALLSLLDYATSAPAVDRRRLGTALLK